MWPLGLRIAAPAGRAPAKSSIPQSSKKFSAELELTTLRFAPSSQDIGSCGYGYTNRGSFPFAFVAGPVTSSKLDLYTGKCGSCVEIKCTGTPLVRSLRSPAGS